MTAPVQGQIVLLKLNSRLHPATIVYVNSGDNVNLVVNSDGIYPWDDGFGTDSFQYPVRVYTNADKGTGTGQWREATVLAGFATETFVTAAVDGFATEAYVGTAVTGLASSSSVTSAISSAVSPLATTSAMTSAISSAVSGLASSSSVTSAISTAVSPLATTSAMTSAISSAVSGLASTSSVTAAVAALASTDYVDDAIAGLPVDDDSGLVVVPAAGSSISLALATPRRPSTTRPTRVSVYGSIALPTAVLAAQSATVEMRAGTSSTPTTVVGGPLTAGVGVGNVPTVTHAWTITYDLPANHYYSIVQSATVGTAAVTITHINETAA